MTTRTPARLAALARRRLDDAPGPRAAAAPREAAIRAGATDLPVRVVAAQLRAMPRAPVRTVRRGRP
ncbi:hypothetical protein [Methylobacterium sp. D54C]